MTLDELDLIEETPVCCGCAYDRAQTLALVDRVRDLEAEVATAKAIVLRGWDDQMASFDLMTEADEEWLLTWAGHPSAPSESSA